MLRRLLPPLVFCAFFVVHADPAASHQSRPGRARGEREKEPAPRFNATTITGEKFSNASVKGKVVLLEFWTTWCHFCAEEESLVEKLSHEFADKGLVVLTINVGESKKTVKKYLEAHPRSTKIILTEDTNLAAMYAANVYPIYVVIDREGNCVTQHGAGGEEALRDLLSSAGLESPSDSDSDGTGN
jgi:thiol-disulfide isomerase/thioredoxin